jgi:uncharacterized membrane protein
MEEVKVRPQSVLTVKRMTRIAMLGAIAAFMSLTPFGYIQIGLVKVTFMHIPVIIGAIMEGAVGGVIVGLIFGISSLVNGLSTPLAPVFLNPMVSIFPRIMIGLISAWVYKKTKNAAITAAAGTLTNTVGVLSMIYVFASSAFANINHIAISNLGKVLALIGIKNGTFEIIMAVIVVSAIAKALIKDRK